MIADQLQHFLLRGLRCVLGEEDPSRNLGVETPLLGVLGVAMLVDLEPASEIERLQADGEGLGRTVIGGVGRLHVQADQSLGRRRLVWNTRVMITLSSRTR